MLHCSHGHQKGVRGCDLLSPDFKFPHCCRPLEMIFLTLMVQHVRKMMTTMQENMFRVMEHQQKDTMENWKERPVVIQGGQQPQNADD